MEHNYELFSNCHEKKWKKRFKALLTINHSETRDKMTKCCEVLNILQLKKCSEVYEIFKYTTVK